MTKIQEVKGKFSIIIPNEIAAKKKLKKGDRFIWQFDENGNMLLIPVED